MELPKGNLPVVEYGFNVAMICLVVLYCFINVFGYLIALYFIQYKDFEKKYPKLKNILNYYKKSSWFFIILEGVIGFIGLILLVGLGFYLYLYKNYKYLYL